MMTGKIVGLIRVATRGTSWLLRLPWSVGHVAGWLVKANFRIGRWTTVAAYVSLVRRRATERRCIGKQVSLVISKGTTTWTVVCGVLIGERNTVVAGSAGTKRRWKRCALVLLRIHEQRVACVERSEGVEVSSFL
jgi:hypothetical protein